MNDTVTVEDASGDSNGTLVLLTLEGLAASGYLLTAIKQFSDIWTVSKKEATSDVIETAMLSMLLHNLYRDRYDAIFGGPDNLNAMLREWAEVLRSIKHIVRNKLTEADLVYEESAQVADKVLEKLDAKDVARTKLHAYNNGSVFRDVVAIIVSNDEVYKSQHKKAETDNKGSVDSWLESYSSSLAAGLGRGWELLKTGLTLYTNRLTEGLPRLMGLVGVALSGVGLWTATAVSQEDASFLNEDGTEVQRANVLLGVAVAAFGSMIMAMSTRELANRHRAKDSAALATAEVLQKLLSYIYAIPDTLKQAFVSAGLGEQYPDLRTLEELNQLVNNLNKLGKVYAAIEAVAKQLYPNGNAVQQYLDALAIPTEGNRSQVFADIDAKTEELTTAAEQLLTEAKAATVPLEQTRLMEQRKPKLAALDVLTKHKAWLEAQQVQGKYTTAWVEQRRNALGLDDITHAQVYGLLQKLTDLAPTFSADKLPLLLRAVAQEGTGASSTATVLAGFKYSAPKLTSAIAQAAMAVELKDKESSMTPDATAYVTKQTTWTGYWSSKARTFFNTVLFSMPTYLEEMAVNDKRDSLATDIAEKEVTRRATLGRSAAADA